MNNFPFFSHWVIKLIFDKSITIDELLMENLAKKMVKNLKLKVVKETSYEFPKHGLTKILILSQSHLIFHSWPEKNAIHIDLLTCSQIAKPSMIGSAWKHLPIKEEKLQKLNY